MSLSSFQKAALTEVVSSPVLWDAPLAAWTTFRIGGPSDALVTLLDVEELQKVLALCAGEGIVWKLLGRGSNILAPDDGFRGVVIVLGDGFKYIVRHGDTVDGKVVVRAGAAVGFSRLADWCAEQGLSGLEFAAGIPGSVGGAVVMNAGASGCEIGDLVYQLSLAGAEKVKDIPKEKLHFSYRCCDDLGRSESGSVVTAVELLLEQGQTQRIQETISKLRRQRWAKQPVGMPTAGSFFKNPAGTSAGQLIEASGLKGLRIGDAEVSEKHANFFVNRGRATAADVIALMHEVQDRVKETSGITLEPEVQFL